MAAMTDSDLPMIGYRVVAFGGGPVIGEVEGIGWYCLRVHRIPGHPGRVVYVPARGIAFVDPPAGAVGLAPGIGVAEVLAAPVPSVTDAGAWHRSPEWWADLLAHFGYWIPDPGWPVGRARSLGADAGDDRFRHARRAVAGLS